MSRRPFLKEAIAAAENDEPLNDNSFGEIAAGSSALGDRRGVLVRVSPDVRRKLKLAALSRGTTVQNLLLEAIAAILEAPGSSERP